MAASAARRELGSVWTAGKAGCGSRRICRPPAAGGRPQRVAAGAAVRPATSGPACRGAGRSSDPAAASCWPRHADPRQACSAAATSAEHTGAEVSRWSAPLKLWCGRRIQPSTEAGAGPPGAVAVPRRGAAGHAHDSRPPARPTTAAPHGRQPSTCWPVHSGPLNAAVELPSASAVGGMKLAGVLRRQRPVHRSRCAGGGSPKLACGCAASSKPQVCGLDAPPAVGLTTAGLVNPRAETGQLVAGDVRIRRRTRPLLDLAGRASVAAQPSSSASPRGIPASP